MDLEKEPKGKQIKKAFVFEDDGMLLLIAYYEITGVEGLAAKLILNAFRPFDIKSDLYSTTMRN